jgi:hypothetical protein
MRLWERAGFRICECRETLGSIGQKTIFYAGWTETILPELRVISPKWKSIATVFSTTGATPSRQFTSRVGLASRHSFYRSTTDEKSIRWSCGKRGPSRVT